MENEKPREYVIPTQEVAAYQHEQLTQSFEISAVLADIGEEYGFDAETCAEIAKLPFDEAFEQAYSYLVQAGLDADEILAAFMEELAE